MALGKKKPDDAAQPPTDDVADDEIAGAFEDPETATEPAPEIDLSLEEPAGGDAGNDLLAVFQGTQIELEDRSAVLELAGDVRLDALLEELQTVAAALGVGVSGSA